MENKIYGLLYNLYSSDLSEKVPKLKYQLFAMSLRSLAPFENKLGCEFCIQRYNREIKLLKYYINGRDKVIDKIIETRNPCTFYDELLQYKIIPIIISNTLWETTLNEVLKCIIYYTYSKKAILDAIIVSSLVFDYIGNNNITEEIIYENAKSRLIEFSIKKFYHDNYDVEIKNNYIINFEKERIAYLLKSDLDELFDEFSSIKKYVLCKINKSTELDDNKTINQNIITNHNNEILKNLSIYMFKLRKGILDLSKLRLDTNSNIDIKYYLKENNFVHPVLGRCILVAKKDNECILKTKTGYIKYNLR